jgi:hypothetical protein
MRVLLYVIPFAIEIYALFDCARTPQDQVRNLPKWGWLIIVILFALVGSIAWFIAGRPKNVQNGGSGPRRGRIIPPDDNPDFLKGL